MQSENAGRHLEAIAYNADNYKGAILDYFLHCGIIDTKYISGGLRNAWNSFFDYGYS